MAMHRQRGDRHSMAIAIINLSEIAFIQGDLVAAEAGARAGLAIFRELGNTNGIAAALHLLGHVEQQHADPATAQECYAESITMLQRQGHLAALTSALAGLALLAASHGQAAHAVGLCSAAEALCTPSLCSFSRLDSLLYEQALAAARPALDPEAYARAWANGQAWTPEQAVAAALAAVN